MEQGERMPVRAVTPVQHFTEPPPRYSEASLVKELERLGIGRPSTYASIISTLVDRRYAQLEQRRFFPTSLGESVEKVMVKQFPDVFNVGFTSEMEGELDKIEEGQRSWQRVLKDFYGPFAMSLDKVDVGRLIAAAHDLSALANERCPDCGGKLVAKGGFFGPFLACEHHPKTCKHTRPLGRDRKPAELTNYMCHECGAPMLKRAGRTGRVPGLQPVPEVPRHPLDADGRACARRMAASSRRVARRSAARSSTAAATIRTAISWRGTSRCAEQCPECGYEGAEAKFTKARGEYRKCLKCANEWDVAPKPDTAEPERVPA